MLLSRDLQLGAQLVALNFARGGARQLGGERVLTRKLKRRHYGANAHKIFLRQLGARLYQRTSLGHPRELTHPRTSEASVMSSTRRTEMPARYISISASSTELSRRR
jgi:hypothetical protein